MGARFDRKGARQQRQVGQDKRQQQRVADGTCLPRLHEQERGDTEGLKAPGKRDKASFALLQSVSLLIPDAAARHFVSSVCVATPETLVVLKHRATSTKSELAKFASDFSAVRIKFG
ncbi:hypothetical protein PC112_g17746 [Phytophthora cactorum]|nr:hypothetical protein PC112_g17746 [Phytophthora cactorum]